MKDTMKAALKFILSVLPFTIIAGVATAYYEMGVGLADQLLEQMSTTQFIAVVVGQTVVYAAVCGFIGYILAAKTGLLRKFSFAKKSVLTAIVCGVGCGIVFFTIDYYIFARLIPDVAKYYSVYPFSVAYLLSEVTYGGVVEEILLRWFLMSLFVLILWKVFARKSTKSDIPVWVFVTANILAAALFALGHLPATEVLFGQLNFIIILRCMLLNGAFGLIFGWLYRKHGIQYAMIAHAMTHICCDALLFLVLRLLFWGMAN